MFNNKTPILGLEYDMMMQRYFNKTLPSTVEIKSQSKETADLEKSTK